MITTQKSLPCLQEMVHNYLSEARLRSWEDDYGLDEGLGRDGLDHDSCDRFEKDRGMKVLQAEERKRREGRECAAAGPKHGIGKTRDRSLHTRKSVPGKTSRGKYG